MNGARWLRAWSVLVVVASSTAIPIALAPAAVAAPGDSSAVGFDANFSGTLAGGTPISLIQQVGATSAPPGGSADLSGDGTAINLTLGPPINQDVRVAEASTISTRSASDSGASTASASAAGIQISTPAGLLAIDGVSSSASCPVGGQPTATATGPTGVTLNDEPVTLDPSGVTRIQYNGPVPPGTATITLTVAPPKIDGTTATATGLLYSLVEDLTDLVSASGTLAIARSTCEAPAPTLTTSGVLREAATGAPLRGCVLLDSTAQPGRHELVWTNGDGSWQYTGNLPGPFALAFFTAANGDCNQSILNSPVPSWYENQPLSGNTVADLTPPRGITDVPPGTTGIVACLGATALPTGPCVEPTVRLSGRALRPDPAGGAAVGVPQACVILLRDAPPDTEPVVGFAIADDQGNWQVTGLPLATPLVVAVIPPFTGPDGPCSSDGPPPAPPAGSLQPEFYRNAWIDLTDPDLPVAPYTWATAHGANPVTGSATGLDVCLTTDPGTLVPRPGCNPTPTSSATAVPTATTVPTATSVVTSSATMTITAQPSTVVSRTTATVAAVAIGAATGSGSGHPDLAATGGPWIALSAAGVTMIVSGLLMVRLARRRAGTPRRAD